MAQKLWIAVLALVFVAVESHVVRSQRVQLPDGTGVELLIRPTSELEDKLEKTEKRFIRKTHDVVVPPATPKVTTKNEGVVIEDRFGIRSGVCPVGYVQRGGFCFPDYD